MGSDESSALIQLGAETPVSTLADLYAPSFDSESVCDVTPQVDSRSSAVLPLSLRRAMREPETVVADVVRELGRS